MSDVIHQLHLKVLKEDGSWETKHTMNLPPLPGGRSWTLRDLLAACIDAERDRRIAVPSFHVEIPQSEQVLTDALEAGGVRVRPGGIARHVPVAQTILANVEDALEDGRLIPVLNGEPCRACDEPLDLKAENDLWFARSAWLHHF